MTDSVGPAPLAPETLRWTCPPVRPSQPQPAASEVLGQQRPLEAMRAGLAIRAPGYHVFVSGAAGSGRRTLVQQLLAELQPSRRPGPDRVYLTCVGDPQRLLLLSLPRGSGPRFQREFAEFLVAVRDAVRLVLSSRPHRVSCQLVSRAAEQRQQRLMAALERLVQQHDAVLVEVETEGAWTADVHVHHGGQALSVDSIAALRADGRLGEAEQAELVGRREDLLERVDEVFHRLRQLSRRTEHELLEVDRLAVRRRLRPLFAEFREAYDDKHLGAYLDGVARGIEDELGRWRFDPADDIESGPPAPEHDPLRELEVHLVKTMQPDEPCPVVFEAHPSYAKLFGSLELMREAPWGLSRVQPGALLRADGGFLVMRAIDLLSEPMAWSQLKRTLGAGQLELREVDAAAGQGAGVLEAESIPLDVKVVLIGEPGQYDHLAADDAQFLPTFKVHAEFDATMPATPRHRARYADLLAWLSRHEGLRAFAPAATAAMVEFGARLAGRRDRLSTRLGEIGDVGREASWVCEQAGPGPVRRKHVEAAIDARATRLDLAREQFERDLADGYLLLRTSGEVVGQVNALTVIDTGTFAFGRPSRITASTGVGVAGRGTLLNIEREADLSGPLHDKGVLVLGGYLLDRFGRGGPLCLDATLCFEQNYGGVDGDSASCAELVVLLSSLAEVPIRQSIGITGSINQKGELQAVSGINEKVEGFFRLCRSRGPAPGGNGVVIPHANLRDLMLDQEVLVGVREGWFRVFAADDVGVVLRILTGWDPVDVLAAAAATLAEFRARGCAEAPLRTRAEEPRRAPGEPARAPTTGN